MDQASHTASHQIWTMQLACFLLLLPLRNVSADVLIVSGDHIPVQLYSQLTESIPALFEAVPVQSRKTTLTSDQGMVDASLFGTMPEMSGMLHRTGRLGVNGLAWGRFLSRADIELQQNRLVLGSMIANQLFPGKNAVGKNLMIDGQDYLVVGILSGDCAPEIRDAAFIPVKRGGPLTEIWLYYEPDAGETRDAVDDFIRNRFPDLKCSMVVVSGRNAPANGVKPNAESSVTTLGDLANGAISLTIALFFVLVAMGIIPMAGRYRRYRWTFWVAAGATGILGVFKLCGIMP